MDIHYYTVPVSSSLFICFQYGFKTCYILYTGTFDVQNATVTSDSEGVLCVTCYFVEGSEAGGCVVELALIGKETDHTFIHVSKTSTESEVTGCARGLLHGEYEIYVFDVGKDGVKSPNAPPAVFISSFTLSSSPIPSPSTNSETTSRVLSLPGTKRTEMTSNKNSALNSSI